MSVPQSPMLSTEKLKKINFVSIANDVIEEVKIEVDLKKESGYSSPKAAIADNNSPRNKKY